MMSNTNSDFEVVRWMDGSATCLISVGRSSAAAPTACPLIEAPWPPGLGLGLC